MTHAHVAHPHAYAPAAFASEPEVVTALRALYRFAVSDETGCADLTSTRFSADGQLAVRRVFVNAGKLFAFTSSLESESLEAFLLQRGMLSRERLIEAEEHSVANRCSLMNSMLLLGLLDPSALSTAVIEHAVFVLAEMVAEGEQAIQFTPGATSPPGLAPLNLPIGGLIARVARANSALTRLRADLDACAHMAVAKVENYLLPLDALALTGRELRIVRAITSSHSLTQLRNDLVHEQMFAAEEADRVLGMMLATDWLVPSTEPVAYEVSRASRPAREGRVIIHPPPPREPRRGDNIAGPGRVEVLGSSVSPRQRSGARPITDPSVKSDPGHSANAVSPPTPTPTAAKPPVAERVAAEPELSLEAMREQLEQRNEQIGNADYFAILGVPRDANDATIKRAFFAFARVYHPDAVKARGFLDLIPLSERVFSHTTEVYQIVSDPTRREDYLRELHMLEASGGLTLDGGSGVRPVTSVDEAVAEGLLMVKRQRFNRAVELLRPHVNDAGSRMPELRSALAWAIFNDPKADAKAAAAEAAKMLNEQILAGDARPETFFYLGQIKKFGGDNAEAEKLFRRCLAADPGHAEAQREVRLFDARKKRQS